MFRSLFSRSRLHGRTAPPHHSPPPTAASPTAAPRSEASRRTRAAVGAALAGAVVVSSVAALPAAAAQAPAHPIQSRVQVPAQLTYEDDGYPGYFSELSIVEDQLSPTADHFSVQASFCMHPQATGADDSIGFDLLWETPISTWEELVGLDQAYTSTVPITDSTGRTVMNATLEFDPAGEVDDEGWLMEMKTTVDLSPVEGSGSAGGCGTLQLPVSAPLMLVDVVAAQQQLQESTPEQIEEFDPSVHEVTFVDADGRYSTDQVRLVPTEIAANEAWADGILSFTGSTSWLLLSQPGPDTAATVTLQDDTLCEEPYLAAIIDSQTLQTMNLEPDLEVSCENGVKTFQLENRLRENRQLLINQEDPRPGPVPASVQLTASFDVAGSTETRTASVTSAAPAGRLTGAWAAPALCPFTPFSDNPAGSRFHQEVRWMQCWEITQGYGADHTFRKNRSITRGESVAFLYRYAQNVGPVFPGDLWGEYGGGLEFWDVNEGHSFHEPVTWASERGLTQGYVDGSFGVSRSINRGELAAFVYRLVDGGHDDDGAPVSTPFPDVPAGHTFDAEIAWLAEHGLVAGYRDGTFRPSKPISRAEVAAVLHRMHAEFVRRR